MKRMSTRDTQAFGQDCKVHRISAGEWYFEHRNGEVVKPVAQATRDFIVTYKAGVATVCAFATQAEAQNAVENL